MKKEKIILGVSILIAALPSAWLYFNWNPEDFLRNRAKTVTIADIEQNGRESCIGFPAGEDIPRLAGEEDMKTTLEPVFTAEPTGVVYTGAYSLKPWVEPYTYKRTAKGRRYGAPKPKPAFLQYRNPDGPFQNHADYLPFYLLKFPDDTYILAQIPRQYADVLRRGKAVTLPVGKKVSKGIPKSLSSLCQKYNVDTGGIYYAFNDEWQKKHEPLFLVFRTVAAVALLFGLSAGLVLIGNKALKVH